MVFVLDLFSSEVLALGWCWPHKMSLKVSSPLPFWKNLRKFGIQFSSVQFSRSVVSNSLQTCEPQHARPPCPSPTARIYPNPCPLSRWSHPTISSSVVPFSSCPQSFPASGSFQMSQLFALGGQSIGVSASPLGWTGWISLLSKGLSRAFSNTTVQKHQFFGAQLSLWSSPHIYMWPRVVLV